MRVTVFPVFHREPQKDPMDELEQNASAENVSSPPHTHTQKSSTFVFVLS